MWEQNYTRRDACKSTTSVRLCIAANYMRLAFFRKIIEKN